MKKQESLIQTMQNNHTQAEKARVPQTNNAEQPHTSHNKVRSSNESTS